MFCETKQKRRKLNTNTNNTSCKDYIYKTNKKCTI